MTYNDRKFDNPINWSFKVGRLFGIDIRVHFMFVLCAVVLVAMERAASDSVPFSRTLIDSLGGFALLFVIVLLHEFGHCFGARYMGGEADEILLWPLGGLASVRPPHTPAGHMVTTVAGPAVNVVICAICALILVLWIGSFGAIPLNPLHPFRPVGDSVVPTLAQSWVLRLYGLSYFIFLINLLPIFPFDGGRILQAWLWPRKGYGRSMLIATGTGMIGAIVIGLFALFQEESWILLMIAVFGYMTCWQTRKALQEYGEGELSGIGSEYAAGYSFGVSGEDETPKPGFFERRRARRVAAKEERRQEIERLRAKRVEDALRKVAQAGLESLTREEERLLKEETERQRST